MRTFVYWGIALGLFVPTTFSLIWVRWSAEIFWSSTYSSFFILLQVILWPSSYLILTASSKSWITAILAFALNVVLYVLLALGLYMLVNRAKP